MADDKKKKASKPKKERAHKYEEKVKTDKSFEELIDILVKPKPKKG